MAKTPFLEKKTSIRGLGAGFVAIMLFFLWLTYAFFNKSFVDSVPVTLTTSNAGLAMPSNADVKLRGMIVGEVRSIVPDGDGIKMKIAIKPSAIGIIPADVSAQIVPKTLFGEKYIDLLPAKTPSGEFLKAGDNIARANVPIEVETLLNDLYPLLEAVQPAELSYTLTAVSEALSGRGEQLGSTLVTANNYLQQINPDVPLLIDDLIKLGEVSDVYANAMPDLGRLLKNLVVTGDTIVAKRSQMQAFFHEGTELAETTTDFLDENGDNIITLAHESRPVLEMLSDYSKTFPCVLEAVTEIVPKLESAFRDERLHIRLALISAEDQPTGYAPDEHGVIPSKAALDAEPLAAPNCHTLPDSPFTHDAGNRAPTPPYEIYQLMGLKDPVNKHYKFNRAAIGNNALVDLVRPSVDGIDTAAQRNDINTLLGLRLGLAPSDVPDLGSLLVGPMIRGSEVMISEAR